MHANVLSADSCDMYEQLLKTLVTLVTEFRFHSFIDQSHIRVAINMPTSKFLVHSLYVSAHLYVVTSVCKVTLRELPLYIHIVKEIIFVALSQQLVLVSLL